MKIAIKPLRNPSGGFRHVAIEVTKENAKLLKIEEAKIVEVDDAEGAELVQRSVALLDALELETTLRGLLSEDDEEDEY